MKITNLVSLILRRSTKHDFQHWNIKCLKNMLNYTLCWKLLLLEVSHRFSVGLRSDKLVGRTHLVLLQISSTDGKRNLHLQRACLQTEAWRFLKPPGSRCVDFGFWASSSRLQDLSFQTASFIWKEDLEPQRNHHVYFFKPNTSDVMSGLGLVMLGMMWL